VSAATPVGNVAAVFADCAIQFIIKINELYIYTQSGLKFVTCQQTFSMENWLTKNVVNFLSCSCTLAAAPVEVVSAVECCGDSPVYSACGCARLVPHLRCTGHNIQQVVFCIMCLLAERSEY